MLQHGPRGALGRKRRVERPTHELLLNRRPVLAVVEQAERQAPAVQPEPVGDVAPERGFDLGGMTDLQRLGQPPQVPPRQRGDVAAHGE
jgi:hypothetical protein